MFRGRLTDAAGERIGNMVAEATAVNRTGEALMTATLWLPGRGRHVAAGKLDFSKQNQGKLAVTGGTGEFEGAGGHAETRINPDTGRVRVDITLTP